MDEPHFDFGLHADKGLLSTLGELSTLSKYLVNTLAKCCSWYRYPNEHVIRMSGPPAADEADKDEQESGSRGWGDGVAGVLTITFVEAHTLSGCAQHDKIYAEVWSIAAN